MKCSNCQREMGDSQFLLMKQEPPAIEWHLCSIDCVTEIAWKLRESQPKLSKSKQP